MNNNTCNIEVYYKDGVILSKIERENAESFMKKHLPDGFLYGFKFIKNFITKETIIPQIDIFFKDNMPSIDHSIVEICEINDGFVVNMKISDDTYEYFQKRNGVENLKKYLTQYFHKNFEINVSQNIVEEIVEIVDDLPFTLHESQEERYISITDIVPFVGEPIENKVSYIKDVSGKEGIDICVCGKVKFLKELSYERKPKKIEDSEEPKKSGDESTIDTQKQPTVRVYYKWVIEGFTGDINCIYFTTKLTKEKMLELKNGDEIVVVGDIEKDKFSNNYTLKIKKISTCRRPESFEEKIEWKQENKDYKYVRPEPIEITKQVDLFGMFEEVVPEYLKGKEIVVYDFETTGLSVQDGAKIIEIGAVKIIDGKIKEKFSCMVNPGEHIADDSTKIHGITDDDVKDAHSIGEVIEDFYKFTRGAILSGYNIVGFDMIFLLKFGKDFRYNFDNEVLDVYKLATTYVKGTRNFKLGTIAEKLGIVLDNAHRAWYDAYATAEVLIKLAENLK